MIKFNVFLFDNNRKYLGIERFNFYNTNTKEGISTMKLGYERKIKKFLINKLSYNVRIIYMNIIENERKDIKYLKDFKITKEE